MPSFRCPVCRAALDEQPAGWRCVAGHHFDRAREGYVNLLPGGRLKSTGTAGDDAGMVRARRDAFDAGLYAPVIDAVAAVVAAAAPRTILDAGCGEGSYLRAAADRSGAPGWGIDISKAAIKLAARRHTALRFAVASSHALPFDDGSFDAILNVFAPRDFAEMMRVLSPAGAAFVVTPGPDHLDEIRRGLYDRPQRHDDDPDAPHCDAESVIRTTVDLVDGHHRRSLLEMTPYWWSATVERRARVVADLRSVTIDMRLRIYHHQSAGQE